MRSPLGDKPVSFKNQCQINNLIAEYNASSDSAEILMHNKLCCFCSNGISGKCFNLCYACEILFYLCLGENEKYIMEDLKSLKEQFFDY